VTVKLKILAWLEMVRFSPSALLLESQSTMKKLFSGFLNCCLLFVLAGGLSASAATITVNPTNIESQLNYVTADSPGSHVIAGGALVNFPGMAPLNHDGVASLAINIPSLGTFGCTGTLLPGGMALVTAAHCVTNSAGNFISGTAVTATFRNPAGGPNITANSVSITPHPGWNGQFGEGPDIAVVQFGSAVSSVVPRYDIYRGTTEVSPTLAHIKVGFGRSGHGNTGSTINDGQKRAGLNSWDSNINFGGADVMLGYDFDNGLVANDAMPTIGGPAHLGFGEHEVLTGAGDSGGPSFLQANDSLLTLSASGTIPLGSIIKGGVTPQVVTLTKEGNNSTTYNATYTGDATDSNITGNTISDAGDVQDYKIAGVTHGHFTQSSPPDIDGLLNNTFGEFGVDTKVTLYQAFLDPFIPIGFKPTATQLLNVTIDDATAGAKSATLTVDNLATTAEFSGRGSLDPNDSVTYTANILDHSEASFSNSVDLNTLNINFGSVTQNSLVSDSLFNISNLVATVGFTAGLDLDSIVGSGDTSVLTTNLATFSNLAAGSFNSFLASFDTSNVGIFSASYLLSVSDQNLPGAISGTSLQLFLSGQVVALQSNAAIPEPGSLFCWLCLGVVLNRAVSRRRKGS